MIQNIPQVAKARELYQKHQRWVPAGFFVLGFMFDTLMLRRIDELMTLLQQALYILISAALIGLELVESVREVNPPPVLRKVWRYRDDLLHFMLGTLLNSYTIFYFKSASALTSFLFIAFLVALLMMNEFKKFGKSQTQVRMMLLSLSLVSYLVSLVPIIWGRIGTFPFIVAIILSTLISNGYYRVMIKNLSRQSRLIKTHLILPFAAVQILFVLLYFARVIPPVPLAVHYMGIYHNVEKEKDEYKLSYTRSKWKFWQHGDQTFKTRAGDSVYCFAQVFSPSRFKDELQIRWLYKGEKGNWLAADAIPLPITGGREEGFRSVSKKSNFQPGEWRVQIETLDNREIGWIGFVVENDTSTDVREFKTELR